MAGLPDYNTVHPFNTSHHHVLKKILILKKESEASVVLPDWII